MKGPVMRLLIAEDDRITRRFLEHSLVRWGYEVVVTSEGDAAWQAMSQADAPQLAILDWLMPGMDGTEICRRVREKPAETSTYIILLTTKNGKEDIVTGLRAGADDYLTKPFDVEELRARVQ